MSAWCCGICSGDVAQTSTGWAHVDINNVIDDPHHVQPRKVTMPEENKTIISHCPRCGKELQTVVPAEGYKRWQEGELIQNALPMLNESQREALMTGFCDECWDAMFLEGDK